MDLKTYAQREGDVYAYSAGVRGRENAWEGSLEAF
jgi:hypothetical protein